ncbi:MAG: hydantoinase/oxoprolinase family protein [Acidobacteriia bacterium]|nr:hydantoinase/oxoprolinase family protein [Terriglobia bacterium]
MYSIDIDVGGTLTDGIFSDGRRLVCAKVDSTAHDLTVCLFDCLTSGATQLGFSDLACFLEQVELLRWSTTITSNVLAEGRGPKIGLIVSKGHEKDLYGAEKTSPVLNKTVSEFNVTGIDGGDGAEILGAVRSLLENGVRRICISLKGGLQYPERELRIKRVIEEQYPDHFLGSVPVLAGSDICKNSDDMTRTYYAIINAYTHSALAATLFKAEDELRYSQGYLRPFLISHIDGGVAGVFKTRAIDTMESGPILGIYGTSYLAKIYGLQKVLALDVGGTTAKVGVIHNGEPVYAQKSDLFGIPVRTRLPYLRSIALGGGSVVSAAGNEIKLGPESMGSFPGPVCYGLGGEKPTLTDAFVAAGLIDPEFFLGGSKHLDLEQARDAIEAAVARPRGWSMEEACRAIVDRAYGMVAGVINSAARELKQDLSDHVLFAYGGNGGLFACGVAERAGIKNVHLFALGPVFSAFGSSVSDLCHVYERSLRVPLLTGVDVGELNRAIQEMRTTGMRDLKAEGIRFDNAECSLELEFSRLAGENVQAKSSVLRFDSVEDLRRLAPLNGDASLEVVRMRVRKTMARPALLEKSLGARDTSHVRTGERTVSYGSKNRKAGIYKWESLQPGNEIAGCALLVSESSTYFVPEGWTLKVDRYGNAQLRSGETRAVPTVAGAEEKRGTGETI